MVSVAIVGIGIALGALAGAVAAALWLRTQRNAFQSAAQAAADAAMRSSQSAFLEAAKSTLDGVRAGMKGELAGLVTPLSDSLRRLDSEMRAWESNRDKMFGGLESQLQSLSRETVALAAALRSPAGRGKWGELTLRRVVEIAGMSSFCDFSEQPSQDGQRPDMIVRVAGGRTLVVDAKAPLSAFLEAQEARDDAAKKLALEKHAQQIARHADGLGSKGYWAQFQPAPELVVMFLPGEHFFAAALESNPGLIERALARNVVIATPVTLISVLKGIAYGWRQQALAENAEQIRRLGAEFQDRARLFAEHFADTGRQLERSVEAYNRAVGSWESRLTPSVRKMRELGAGSADEVPAVEPVDIVPRSPE